MSELVGEVMENAVEGRLARAQITYRPTKRAERIPGFKQAPDFIGRSNRKKRLYTIRKVVRRQQTNSFLWGLFQTPGVVRPQRRSRRASRSPRR